eukprot:121591_1
MPVEPILHIRWEHNLTYGTVVIKHLKPRNYKSTKNIKCVQTLSPMSVHKSSMPWRDIHKVAITGGRVSYGAGVPKQSVLDVLNELHHVKYLTLSGCIHQYRLDAYPSFKKVVSLSLLDLGANKNHTGGSKSLDLISCWLNKERFPSLQSLQLNIPGKMTSYEVNALLKSLNLSSLFIHDYNALNETLQLKIPSSINFLQIGQLFFFSHLIRNFVSKLDLSESNLIGMRLDTEISNTSIKWNTQHP